MYKRNRRNAGKGRKNEDVDSPDASMINVDVYVLFLSSPAFKYEIRKSHLVTFFTGDRSVQRNVSSFAVTCELNVEEMYIYYKMYVLSLHLYIYNIYMHVYVYI